MYRTIILLTLSVIFTSCSYSENGIPSSLGDTFSLSGGKELTAGSPNNTLVDSTTLSNSGIIIASSGSSGSIPQDDLSPTAPRATDIASMENIMNNPGLSQCEKITDSNIKEQCLDSALYIKSTLTKNPVLCNGIKNKKILGTCIANSSILSSTGTIDPCSDIDDIEIQKSCTAAIHMNQAISKMDPILCEEIVDTTEQSLCKNNIVMIKATKNKDALVCMQMDVTDQQEKCKEIIMGMK